MHASDYRRFDVGERFYYQPLLRAELDAITAQGERWGLDDYLREKTFDSIALPVLA